MLSIIKLTATFSIEVTAFSKAVVGALFAKSVLILDESLLARRLDQCSRIVAVAVKTFTYGAITGLLGFLERLLEARHRVHNNFLAAGHYVIAQLYRLRAWSLGITLVFGLYFALVEISERVGKEELWTLFFQSPKSPKAASGSSQWANVIVGNVR